MAEWISQYWYVLTGIAGAAIYFGLARYSNDNPDSSATLFLQRCSDARAASIVFGATAGVSIMILLNWLRFSYVRTNENGLHFRKPLNLMVRPAEFEPTSPWFVVCKVEDFLN